MSVTVYLDTSFLMLSAKFHIDVISEAQGLLQQSVEFVVPASVLRELKALSCHAGNAGRDAKVALEMVNRPQIRIEISDQHLHADSVLAHASQLERVLVATADHELRKKIRAVRKPVIFLREKAKLELEGIEPGYW